MIFILFPVILKSLLVRILLLTPDSESVHVNLIVAVSPVLITELLNEPKLQIGAVLSKVLIVTVSYVVLSLLSLNHT